MADTRKWFKTYKIPDGKPENNFAFDGEYKDKAFADKTIADTYTQWQALVRGKTSLKPTLFLILEKFGFNRFEKNYN